VVETPPPAATVVDETTIVETPTQKETEVDVPPIAANVAQKFSEAPLNKEEDLKDVSVEGFDEEETPKEEALGFDKVFSGITESMVPQIQKEITEGTFWTSTIESAQSALSKMDDTYEIVEKSKTVSPKGKPSFEVKGYTISKKAPLIDDEGNVNQGEAAPVVVDVKADIERRRKHLEKGLERIDKILGNNKQIETEKQAIEVLNEVHRFRKNHKRSGLATKEELTQMDKFEQEAKEKFGLEIVSQLGKKYDERQNIDVINFNTVENSQGNERLIIAEDKPQINKDGVLTQRAIVDVLQGLSKQQYDAELKALEGSPISIDTTTEEETDIFHSSEPFAIVKPSTDFTTLDTLNYRIEERSVPLSLVETEKLFQSLKDNKEIEEDCSGLNTPFDY
jgi:hypothetical protein